MDAEPYKRTPMGTEYLLHTALELSSVEKVCVFSFSVHAWTTISGLQRYGGLAILQCAVERRQSASRKLSVLRLLLERKKRLREVLESWI
jgi:hypothetical protein